MYQRIGPYPNEYPTLGDLVKRGYKIFDESWCTYVPEHKEALTQKIIDRYFFEEIGVDTPDRFIFNINAHLREIMPYYNQLYYSQLLDVNPLLTHSINASTRTVENLLKRVNTSNDKLSKAIRDFAGVTEGLRIGDKTGKVDSTVSTTGNISETGDVTIDAVEHGEKNTTDDFTGHTVTDEDGNKNINGTETTTGNTRGNTDETGDVTKDTDGQKIFTPQTEEVKDMQYGSTEGTKKETTGTSQTSGTSTDNWTEKTTDDATTTTDTTLTEDTTASGKKDYADTPQKKLSPEAIRSDYLTNVTWTDDGTDHTSDTDQTQKYDDEMNKTHTGDGSKNENGETTETVDGSVIKTGNDTETTTHSGEDVTDTQETETTTKNLHTTSTEDVTKQVKTDQDETSKVNTTQDKKDDRDINEVDDKESTTTKTNNLNTDETGTEHTDGTSTTKEKDTTNQQTREKRKIDEVTTTTEQDDTSQTTDTGEQRITSGFMNVSSSALIEAFRRTFINVDQMIVDELATNFLLTM